MSKAVSCNYKLYAIVDLKAKAIVGTFTSVNDESATRSFMNMLTAPQDNIYNTNPADFSVFHVADLGYSAGVVISEPGTDVLAENGFTCSRFTSDHEIVSGSSISLDLLTTQRLERRERYQKIMGLSNDHKEGE